MSDGSAAVVHKLTPVVPEPAVDEKKIWLLQRATQRPLASEDGHFTWNMQRVRPPILADGQTTHPGRTCAIFVVHGIGQQHWTETAAQLRGGFEDAFEEIADWQEDWKRKEGLEGESISLSAPFIYEGYWANYDDLKETFPEDFKHFSQREQDFFGNLWRHRVISGGRTFWWTLWQQARLLLRARTLAWLLYLPLQVVGTATLLYLWLRRRAVITGYLNDVRLYLDPRGAVEHAIVQQIDARVERAFLCMIGLDMDFRPLPRCRWVEAGGEAFNFDRVVWVAHSLGTVISYNVLSDLFQKGAKIEEGTDVEQKEGVRQFRKKLTRFVTMGSPLDKVAYLFGDKSLRPWPVKGRRGLVESGERITEGDDDPHKTEWWINFYHVLDPVSGSLQNPTICGEEPPSNIHIRNGFLPGIAHLAYWTDTTALRFILGRTYGPRFLKDREFRPWPLLVQKVLAIVGYFTFAAILIGSAIGLIHWGPDILDALKHAAIKWITG